MSQIKQFINQFKTEIDKLDGLNPRFEQEPEKVLDELTTIINNIKN